MNLQLGSLGKNLGFSSEKMKFWKKSGVPEDDDDMPPARQEKQEGPEVDTTSSSILRALGKDATLIESYYFPPDVIGGMCPQVPGSEEEIAWNAAAEACDSERIHIVWQSYNGFVWYIAVRSSALASQPNSWCPFAAVLPGMKEARTPPVCYTHYGEDIATMMTVTEEGLHIYRGTNPIVRAKAERTAREMGNAAIVDLIPEQIASYEPIPWYSVSLFEERARRFLATGSVALSLVLTSLAFMVWLLASVALITAQHDLDAAKERTDSKTLEIMNAAQKIRATPVREEMTKFATLNDGLLNLNGYLEVYSMTSGRVRWRATVPPNVTADRINALGGKTIDTTVNGTVIGNAAEVDYEEAKAHKQP